MKPEDFLKTFRSIIRDVIQYKTPEYFNEKSVNYFKTVRPKFSEVGDYIERLERDCVYFAEVTPSTLYALIGFVRYGLPRTLAEPEIPRYVDYAGRFFVLNTEYHLPIVEYIRGERPRIKYQMSNIDWEDWKNFRQNFIVWNSQEEIWMMIGRTYQAELEARCRFFRATTELADTIFSYVLHQSRLKGIARDLPPQWIFETLYTGIINMSRACLPTFEQDHHPYTFGDIQVTENYKFGDHWDNIYKRWGKP